MPSATPTEPAPAPKRIAAQAIFAALGNEKRRRLLVALAAGPGKAASQLGRLVGLRQDTALKHLIELRAAGLVSMAPDPTDARRQLYTLTPAVAVQRTATGLELDFGCCLVRV